MTQRPLDALRVIELADEQAEWAGKSEDTAITRAFLTP